MRRHPCLRMYPPLSVRSLTRGLHRSGAVQWALSTWLTCRVPETTLSTSCGRTTATRRQGPGCRLVVPPRRSGGQERYLDRSLPEEIGADLLAEVVARALEHLHEQLDVETLAYMSRRDPAVTRSWSR